MSPLPSAVLFDMDGTLIDSEGLWLQAEISVMAQLGADWGPQDQAQCLGGPLERVSDYMVERSGTRLPASQIGDLLLGEMEHRLRSAPVVWQPGAQALLAECHELGLPTALVSASWSRLIEAVRDRIDADFGRPAFDVVVAGDDVTWSKPHPEPYLTAAGLLGVEPSECLVLEDSPTGVESGASAGCRVVAIPHIAVVQVPGVAQVSTLAGRSVGDLWQLASNG